MTYCGIVAMHALVVKYKCFEWTADLRQCSLRRLLDTLLKIPISQKLKQPHR